MEIGIIYVKLCYTHTLIPILSLAACYAL
jgi:hypothetical protein